MLEMVKRLSFSLRKDTEGGHLPLVKMALQGTGPRLVSGAEAANGSETSARRFIRRELTGPCPIRAVGRCVASEGLLAHAGAVRATTITCKTIPGRYIRAGSVKYWRPCTLRGGG